MYITFYLYGIYTVYYIYVLEYKLQHVEDSFAIPDEQIIKLYIKIRFL